VDLRLRERERTKKREGKSATNITYKIMIRRPTGAGDLRRPLAGEDKGGGQGRAECSSFLRSRHAE